MEDIYETCHHNLKSQYVKYYSKGSYYDGYYGYEFEYDSGTSTKCPGKKNNVVLATGYADGHDISLSTYAYEHEVYIGQKLIGFE